MVLPVPVDTFYCDHMRFLSLTETDFLEDTCVQEYPEHMYIPCHQEDEKSERLVF